jgi:hypothetical protein
MIDTDSIIAHWKKIIAMSESPESLNWVRYQLARRGLLGELLTVIDTRLAELEEVGNDTD